MVRKLYARALVLTPILLTLAPAMAWAAAPASIEAEIIRLTNVERQKAGVPLLRQDATITDVAADYADLMARKDQLDHNLDGDAGDRLTPAGYRWSSWGENIACKYADAAAVVHVWMSDEGHKQNMLNPNFTEIGVGVARNAKGQPYYDLVFAQPGE